MASSGLLTSCAMEAASRPTAASFSDSKSCCSTQRLVRLRVDQLDLGLAVRLGGRSEGGDEARQLDGVGADGGRGVGGERVPLLEEEFGAAVKKDEVAARVADDDGVAHVLDNQIEAVALAARLRFGLLQLREVACQFLVRLAQVRHVAEDGDQP
jgi:hypothetical protein